MGYIRNAVLIKAPVDEVLRLTNNVRTWPDLFTEYASSEVIEEDNEKVVFRLTTHPDENNHQWSWIATRWTDQARKSTYSERDTSSGPFDRMVIRWWYDAVDAHTTCMTWEQDFRMKPQAPLTDEGATAYLNKQTKIQQGIIKQRVEQLCNATSSPPEMYRSIIVGRYTAGHEEDIAAAFQRSDATDLPYLIGVKSRHIWVQDGNYIHFVESQIPLKRILQEYKEHPLYQEVKAEVDPHVFYRENQLAVGKEIYAWHNPDL